MSDITCRKCGEPFEAYGVYHRTDMDEEEAQRFLRCEGCPCCDFGAKCPMCRGTGFEECPRCNRLGYLPTHRRGERCDQCPPASPLATWNQVVERCPAPKRKPCDLCDGTGRNESIQCGACHGTGKPAGEHFERFLETLVESTDEDPIEMINNVVMDQE